MTHPEWSHHPWVNQLQSAVLILFMAGFLGLLGWIIWGPSGFVVLLSAAVMMMIINPGASPRLVLRLYRAQPLTGRQAPELATVMRMLADRARLPSTPALYYVPSPMVNAFAVGERDESAIAITDGLLQALEQRELVGVLAHEVSHIRNNDLRVMRLADLISRLTTTLSFVGQLLLFINLPLILFSEVQVNWLAIGLLIFAPHLSWLALAGLSRTREYHADLNAIRLTGDPQGLASALIKIERRQHSLLRRLILPGWGRKAPSWLRSHPATEERVRRLHQLAERQSSSGPLHHRP